MTPALQRGAADDDDDDSGTGSGGYVTTTISQDCCERSLCLPAGTLITLADDTPIGTITFNEKGYLSYRAIIQIKATTLID